MSSTTNSAGLQSHVFAMQQNAAAVGAQQGLKRRNKVQQPLRPLHVAAAPRTATLSSRQTACNGKRLQLLEGMPRMLCAAVVDRTDESTKQ